MNYEKMYVVKKNNKNYNYCLQSMILLFSFFISIITFLNLEYMKALVNGIKDSNIQEVVQIFEALKECIEAAHICQK
jgi:hypothetical protein